MSDGQNVRMMSPDELIQAAMPRVGMMTLYNDHPTVEIVRRLRKLAEIEAAAGTPPDDETFADWQERMFKVDTVLTRD